MTDSEMEDKFNGPRDRLFEKIFGKLDPKKVKEAEEKANAVECTTTLQEMAAKNRASKGMPTNPWLGEYNRRLHAGNGKIVTKISENQLNDLKEVPDPIK